ncbi:MAG: amidohydrolase family protein, partial [Nocardioidaceae bacterium]
ALTRAQRHLDGGGDPDDLNSVGLARVLSGEIPWRQHVHRADDIMTAIRLADEFGYNLVIDHGTEADLVADRIAERGIPVITGPLVMCRYKEEMKNRSLGTPGRLAAAGVKIAIATDHGVVPVQFLPYQAALAVREGLDRTTALEALTISPAEILGIDDRLGTLEPGKDADICIWTGDPLDIAQRVETAYIQGQPIYHYDHQRHTGVLDGEDWSL